MRSGIVLFLFFLVVPAFMVTGCKSKDSGSIEYIKEIPGKARIVSIDPSGEPGMLYVYFDFIPGKPLSTSEYTYPQVTDKNIKLYQDHRESFHRNWIEKWNIRKGNLYPATRYERVNKSSPINNVNFEIFFDKGPL